jgi:mannonate dehydratase
MDRRGALHFLSAGAVGGGLGLLGDTSPLLASAAVTLPPPRGLPSLKITDIKTILTAPDGIRLVIVKIMTSEPGLYGLGCATFTQRAYVVATAVEQYLKPFLLGRNPDDIEDIWQSSYVSSYWRNGGVLFNAMSGVDEALWDIKAKRAAMPLYQLLGGRCRLGADLYYHASGGEFAEVEDAARKAMELGYRYVRIQAAVPGLATYGVRGTTPATDALDGPSNPTRIWEPGPYVRMVPRLFEHMRVQLGEEVELLHDVHERITLPQAVQLCKDLEKYRPYFIEDPVPPEENDYFRILRPQTSVPLAMGELFNNQQEYVPLITGRLIDFVRAETAAGRLTLTAPPPTPLSWWLARIGNAALVLALGLLALPFLIVLSPFLILRLRRLETTDPEICPSPDPAALLELQLIEDFDVTNQYTAFGSVKPGWFRRWLLTLVLVTIQFTCRNVFTHGYLARVQTIHFARWVFLDGKRRIIFASNYDGSLESYMDDFINKVAFGLNVVFTNSPRRLEEFQGMSDFLQTSPESGFVRTRTCTVALPDGRLRLRELVLTERHGDEVSERELAGEQEWRDCLLERFGVAL